MDINHQSSVLNQKLNSVTGYIHPYYQVAKFLELGYHTDKMVDDPDLATGITDLQSAVILFHQSSKMFDNVYGWLTHSAQCKVVGL